MVKISNVFGDRKTGIQGEAVYQLHYGQQVRRTRQPKIPAPSQHQIDHRQKFQQALTWRSALDLPARQYLDGYAIAHRIIDSYGIPLGWDKIALKIALQTPIVTIL